jgi:trimeric autotransporter adhesin
MANFPVYHGITLAENSWVENFHVEILTSDPVPLTAGRVWYNSTDKVFRQSTLNEGGAVVVKTFATVEELDADIAAVEAALAAETTARVAADTTLQANIAAEEAARIAADATLQSNLDAESAARSAADTTLQANLDAEAAARAAADATLQSAVDAEVAARAAADATLQSAVDAEVAARAAADATLQANLDAEAAARAAADATLQSAVDAEEAARIAGDTTLQSNIDALSSQVTALGNAFNYVGALEGGAEGTPLDLTTLPEGQKDAGDYFKVTTAGWFVVGAGTAFFANIGDGIVWNIFGGVDKIDNTDSNVQGTTNEIAVTGSADTGFVVGIDTAFKDRVSTLESGATAEAAARAAADATLQANIDAEAAARAAADNTLQANIDAEAAARAAADATLQSAVDAEAAARAAADTTLQAAIDAEAAARAAADATISANVGDLTALTTDANTSLVAAINELDAALAGGTEAVRDAYDATIFTYESVSPAATHVINHNLNSAFVDFSVMIQRADGNWYNDIASIASSASDPTNVATLYLSTAQNVKVIARSAVKLGLVA